MDSHENQSVVEVKGLSRRFGRKEALRDVSLHVERGQVFGLVGENGAGKTTLIQHLLGAYKAQAGEVHVFGIDPVYDPTAVLARIGYLSEDRDLPGWMRVAELMHYTQAFYPNWDPDYAERLREQFELPAGTRIRSLSRGGRRNRRIQHTHARSRLRGTRLGLTGVRSRNERTNQQRTSYAPDDGS